MYISVKQHYNIVSCLVTVNSGSSEVCCMEIVMYSEWWWLVLLSPFTRHSIETERQRENLLNAERTRREKWMQEQSKKIKVMESC